MKPFVLFLFLGMMIFGCSVDKNSLCEVPTKFPIINFDGFQIYSCLEDALSCAREQGKRVFVVFSGHGCVSDKRFEETLFIKKKCSELLAKHFITVLINVDDKKLLPIKDRKEVEWFDGNRKYIKTLGQLNHHYEWSKFDNNSQPLFVILDQQGNVVIEPIGFQSDQDEYYKYLLKGIVYK